ncbi:hypothetical protein D9M71_358620 [compost metagenome]
MKEQPPFQLGLDIHRAVEGIGFCRIAQLACQPPSKQRERLLDSERRIIARQGARQCQALGIVQIVGATAKPVQRRMTARDDHPVRVAVTEAHEQRHRFRGTVVILDNHWRSRLNRWIAVNFVPRYQFGAQVDNCLRTAKVLT